MVKLSWHTGPVPEGMRIRQVYGVIFNEDGQTLMKVDNFHGNRVYTIAGGTVEKFDKDMIDTLRREMKEEINTELHEPIYIGYQLVENDGNRPPYAQVRMTAMIKNIGPSQPDPDKGETYGRFFTSPENAKKLLNWGDIGIAIIDEAVKVAKQNWKLKDCSKEDRFLE